MVHLATGVFGFLLPWTCSCCSSSMKFAVFPMYLLISIWGWKETREYAAMKLTLYAVHRVSGCVGRRAGDVFHRPVGHVRYAGIGDSQLFSYLPKDRFPVCLFLGLLYWVVSSRSIIGARWSRGSTDCGLNVPLRVY